MGASPDDEMVEGEDEPFWILKDNEEYKGLEGKQDKIIRAAPRHMIYLNKQHN